jgi:Zn-finger nucleic acid-binding protein
MCGAAASSDASRCEHCGARLATVACPACFGMMFVGAKFCSHCGTKAAREEIAPDAHESCPRCKIDMEKVLIGKTQLEECPQCEGVWADADSVRQICADSEQQSAVLGMAQSTPAPTTGDVDLHIHYIPCPVCKNLMNRINFAHCSNVIVNVCNQHGTWFDKDQLRRIVEFIRSGGLEKMRTREFEELEDRRRSVAAQSAGSTPGMDDAMLDYYGSNRHVGISAVASMIGSLFDL